MRISLLIVILYCTPLFALGTEDVLFHAPFEGAPDAHLAAGDGKAITAGELQYTDGVRGRAVIVGGPAPADGKGKPSSIMYQTDSNLLIEEGSVSLWVKAIDWKIPDGHNHQFLTIPGTGVTYYLYVFYPGNTWWLLLKKDGNRPIGSYEPAWAPGEWHHLVATWREGEMAVYVDGEQTGRATENVPLPSAYGKNFWMGQFDNFHTAFDELIIFRKALTPVEVKALYSSVAKAPAPASAVIGDDPNSPAQVAGLLDSVTGQVVLDEDVTAQLWADEQTLHVKLCWAIPEYFRLNPTAYNGRALKRGAEALAENDAFEVTAGKFSVLVGPDGAPGVKSDIDMNRWLVEVDIPREEWGGDAFDFRFSRRWKELRRMDATWKGRLTIQPGAKTAQVTTEDLRKLAAAVPLDIATHLQVQRGDAFRAELPYVNAAPFTAELQLFPSAQKLVVETSKPDAQVAVAGETKTGEKRLTFDISKLSIGEHEAVVTLGEVVKKLSFSKKPPPEWLTAKVGITEDVPPPWSELTVKGNAVGCWGRDHHLGDLFPTQIRSQGQELLAAPIRLRAGDTIAKGTAKITEKNPADVRAVAKGRLGPVSVNVETLVEYDGYVWFDVTLSPPPNGQAKLDPVIFEIPMKPELATLFYSGSYTLQDTGALPKEGYTGVWRHRFWVGNETAGIQWFCESGKNWRITKPEETLRIKDGLIQLAIADEPVTITTPLNLSFGVMAIPVRPRRPDWRTWRFGKDEVNTKGWQYVSLWNTHWGTRWNYPVLKPTTAESLRTRYSAAELPCLYGTATTIASNTPEFRHYSEEWRVAPSAKVDFSTVKEDDENAYAAVCPNSSYTDFYIWALNRAIKEADIRALYFDVSHAPLCNNESHGCGWREASGKLHGTYALRATREFQKRVYTIAKQNRPNFLVTIHMSGDIFMPQHSFSEVMIDGENFTGVLQRQWAADKRGDYFRLLPLDKMRAEMMLSNFGTVSAFLPEFARSLGDRWWSDDPEVMQATEHLVGLFTLHDAPVWQAYMPDMPLRKVWYAQSRFGWDEKVEFIPYWKSEGILSLGLRNPDVVASIFKRPGKMMVVAMNNTDEDVEIALSWNEGKLGVSANTDRVIDYYTGGGWRIKDGRVPPIPLRARSFRMLVPEARQ